MRPLSELKGTVIQTFLQPLSLEFEGLEYTRQCEVLPDWDWLVCGTMRVIGEQKSGRGFLQHFSQWWEKSPRKSHYFETLKSERRLRLCEEVNRKVVGRMKTTLRDGLAGFECLKGYEVYAGDGHFHEAATHDQRKGFKDTKYATGHLYTVNLRDHGLSHLKVCDVEAKREHDIKGLKALSAQELRQGAAKGTKVLLIWDRAGIDFGQWWRWKKSAGLYLISRQKENMKPQVLSLKAFDSSDPVNTGVLRDEYIGVSAGVMMRRVSYQDAISGEEYAFITSEMDLPPGMIAHLYRMRWDIEKVFDEIKNKLEERKSWASTETAKAMQAQFICLAHNLMLLMEHFLKEEKQIVNVAEECRRQKRRDQEKAATQTKNRLWPEAVDRVLRLTQRSLKFVRWLRVHLPIATSLDKACPQLQRLYATL